MNVIAHREDVDTNEHTITIYGEWAGKGVQSGVAISQLDRKAFFVFGVKISQPDNEDFKAYWVDCKNLSAPDADIYNVNDYQTFEIDIDFQNPGLSQNELIAITEKVEEECPIGKALLAPDNSVTVTLRNDKLEASGLLSSCVEAQILPILKNLAQKHENPSITLTFE